MKKFVQISNNTGTVINVIPSIALINATNVYSPLGDRLNVKPAWVGMKIKIEPGLGFYPAQVKDWDDVKALAKANKFTIGLETDGEGMPEEWIEKATEAAKKLENAMTKFENDVKRNEEILAADKNRPGAH